VKNRYRVASFTTYGSHIYYVVQEYRTNGYDYYWKDMENKSYNDKNRAITEYKKLEELEIKHSNIIYPKKYWFQFWK